MCVVVLVSLKVRMAVFLGILKSKFKGFLGSAQEPHQLLHLSGLEEALGSAAFCLAADCGCASPFLWQLVCMAARGGSCFSACASGAVKAAPLLAAGGITALNCCCQPYQRFKARKTVTKRRDRHSASVLGESELQSWHWTHSSFTGGDTPGWSGLCPQAECLSVALLRWRAEQWRCGLHWRPVSSGLSACGSCHVSPTAAVLPVRCL